ncbi:MAG: hypothetical protein Q9200_003829 [Gallowayella weberi]
MPPDLHLFRRRKTTRDWNGCLPPFECPVTSHRSSSTPGPCQFTDLIQSGIAAMAASMSAKPQRSCILSSQPRQLRSYRKTYANHHHSKIGCIIKCMTHHVTISLDTCAMEAENNRKTNVRMNMANGLF